MTAAERITEAIARSMCATNPSNTQSWERLPAAARERWMARARYATAAILDLPDVAVVKVPEVGYKAQGETDAQRYRAIAGRIRDNQSPGGSNSRSATAELLERVALALDGVS